MYQTVYTELSIQLMPICMFCYMMNGRDIEINQTDLDAT